MKVSLSLCAFFVSTLLAFSQAVQVDPTFDPGIGPNPGGEVNAIQLVLDGKILVGGAFTTWNGAANRGLVRLNNDGSLDPGFAFGVEATVNRIFFQDSVLWVQANDKLYRLQENGALDTTVPPFQISGMAIASGDNIYRVYVGQRPRPFVEVYNAQGQYQRMLMEGSVGDHAYVMEPLPGGEMLLGGAISKFTQNLVAFTPSGINSNFVSNAPRGVREMALGPDTIYVAADNSVTTPLTFARLNGSGQLDPTFNAQSAAVSTMAVTPDRRLVYGNHDVVRLNLDGSVDTNFTPQFNANANINDLTAQPDGRVLVGGSFASVDGLARRNIARLLAEADVLPPGATNPPGGGNPPDDPRPPDNAPGVFSISGFVTDGVNGIPGVRVKLRRQIVFTDENGAYQLTDLRAGRYRLHVTARGFRIKPAFKRVRVNGDVTDVDFLAREKRRRH